MATETSTSTPRPDVRRRRRADPRGPPALRVAAARAAQRAERPRRAAPPDRRAARRARRGGGEPGLPPARAQGRDRRGGGRARREGAPGGLRDPAPAARGRASSTTRTFSNALHEFSETLLHHLDEEERDILNPAREDVTEEDRASLGAAWAAERNRMLDEGCGSTEQVRALVDGS